MNRGARGAEVGKVQRALIYLGFPLLRFGADEDLGDETIEAFEQWYEVVSDTEDIEFGDGLPAKLIEQLLEQYVQTREEMKLKFGPNIVDVRDGAWKGAEHGRNPIERIDTICLHQMAVKDSDYQGWERWRKLAIHFVVTCGDNAKAYLLHDLDVRVWHGHGWNPRSVGFELEGWFSGIGTDPKYFWQPKGANRTPMVPTEQQLRAACDAVRYTVDEIASMGGEIKYMGAHRQSYGYKESDPGSLIWQGVALPMMEELGLAEAPVLERKTRSGKPIPEAWDPRNVGVPYRG